MGPIDRVVNVAVQPVLERAGFTRRKWTWNRLRGEFVDVIDVQKASYDPNTFTINVGVMVPELYKLVHDRRPSRFVGEPDCVVRLRIGELLRQGDAKRRDKWWELGSETEELNCQRELGDALPERALPFLDGLNTLHDVHSYLESQTGFNRHYVLDRLFLAAARHRVGDVEGAMRELAEARLKAGSWTGQVDAVQRALSRSSPAQRPT